MKTGKLLLVSAMLMWISACGKVKSASGSDTASNENIPTIGGGLGGMVPAQGQTSSVSVTQTPVSLTPTRQNQNSGVVVQPNNVLVQQPSSQASGSSGTTPPNGILAAEEARRTAVAAITAYYQYYVGREPDVAGLQYWVNVVMSGRNLVEVGNMIANSPEALERQRKLAEQSFKADISRYYRLYLGRDPDAGGMAYYLDLVTNRGYSVAQVENIIANSYEAQVRGSYLRHLNREPDRGGIEFYMGQMSAGVSFAVIDSVIRNSPESQIRQMYLRYLKREPDLAGLQYWVGQANAGMPLSTIDNAIRNSPEAMTK